MHRRDFVATIIAGWTLPHGVRTANAAATVMRPRLGMNFAGPKDWSTELPFADVFRQSRFWVSQREGQPWGKGPELELDDSGWVRRLAAGCWAETPLCTIEGGGYPSGEYTLLYEGRGAIRFNGPARVKESAKGRMLLDVDSSRGGFFLQIRETDPSDYIRNIRVMLPGLADQPANDPWNPDFLKIWSGVACIRCMDLMHTNNSEISRWEERPKLTDATFTVRGVPLELLVDLANRMQSDVWFCMPHGADDEYVRQFAMHVRDHLDPARKAWLEYSNEVWNGQFAQQRYAGAQGQQLGFADKPWEAAWKYTAHRSLEIFRIWENVVGLERLVRVLPSQASNAYVARQILSFEDAGHHADVLAIAPYISMNCAPGGMPDAATVAGWSVEQVLDYAEQQALPASIRWMEENAGVAAEYGLQLAAYEGGQHFVGVAGAENNEQLTRVLQAANSHPRMQELYRSYFDAWEQAGGGMFCYFSSTSADSKWGSWGLLQSQQQNPADSPKFQAVAEWAARLGQPLGALQ